jgi:hypothetical protein
MGGEDGVRTGLDIGREGGSTEAPPPAVICTAADDGFYLGLVALLNSLHLTGHSDLRVVVLDAGLTPEQRRTVEPLATLVTARPDARRASPLVKAETFALPVEGIVLMLDADCIVTGSLDPIFRLASSGKICAARDDLPPGGERRFAEWETLFGLSSPVRSDGTYVNAGAVCFSTHHWPELLSRWAQLTRLLPSGLYLHGPPERSPIWAADQDVFNAILMSEVPASALEVLPPGTMAYAQWPDVRIASLTDAAVYARGRASTFVHFSLHPKPWGSRGWKRVGREPLLPLFARCLLGDDLAIRVDPSIVPWWLHPERQPDLLRRVVAPGNAVGYRLNRIVWGGYDKLPEGCRMALRELRGRKVATMPPISSRARESAATGDTRGGHSSRQSQATGKDGPSMASHRSSY